MTTEFDYLAGLGLSGTLQDKRNAFFDSIATRFPRILAQSAVPVILAPNGTVATNGAITLGTALPTTYSGGAWVRLPAGAVVGGLAGLYWTIFSSTTVGAVKTLFIDPATAFTPYVPTVELVAATGSNAAYTQTTAADITLANITVPGGAMGANGSLKPSSYVSFFSSAGAKTAKILMGATTFLNLPITTQTSYRIGNVIRNRGTTAQQMYGNSGTTLAYVDGGSNSGLLFQSTVNTAIDQALTFTGQLAVATDYIVLEALTVEVLPS